MVQLKIDSPGFLIAAMLLFTVWLQGCGCLILGRTQEIEHPFTEEQVKMIKHGETTKKHILDWFGPPTALALRGSDLKVPEPREAKSGPEDVRSDSFTRIFPISSAGIEQARLYYYYDSEYHWNEFYIVSKGGEARIPPVPEKMHTERRLWVLIDGQSGRVVDHIMELTETGGPSQKAEKKPSGPKAGALLPGEDTGGLFP